jgi:hypothetical protein
MKKLLVNGCSFVAGHELVWQQYLESIGLSKNLNFTDCTNDLNRSDQLNTILMIYKNHYRKKYNLPALIAKKLTVEAIDISEDGSSNDAIALTTIQALLKIPEHERKNYHIIIGWTALMRFLKYSEVSQTFLNININHLNEKKNHLNRELRDYLISVVRYTYDCDAYYNYIRNILMLESFLKANQCTYTFYRNIGDIDDCKNIYPLPIHQKLKILNTIDAAYSDDRCWVRFSENDKLASEGRSFYNMYMFNKKENWISTVNDHPNTEIVDKFSDRLIDFIKDQKVGF